DTSRRRVHCDERWPRPRRLPAGGAGDRSCPRAVGTRAGRHPPPRRVSRGIARGERLRPAAGAGAPSGSQGVRLRARPPHPRSLHSARRRSGLPLHDRARRSAVARVVPRPPRRRGGRERPPREARGPLPGQVLRREGGRGGGACGARSPHGRRTPRAWGLGAGDWGSVEWDRRAARALLARTPKPQPPAPSPASRRPAASRSSSPTSRGGGSADGRTAWSALPRRTPAAPPSRPATAWTRTKCASWSSASSPPRSRRTTSMAGRAWCSCRRRSWSAGLGGPDPRPLTPVLVGPTGVGKTAAAVALAAVTPLTVISADARQVYRGLDIGTAKPDAATLARVPHRGVDLVDVGERYSAGRFAREAAAWLADLRAAGRWAVVV